LEKHSKLLEKLEEDYDRPSKKQKVIRNEAEEEGEWNKTGTFSSERGFL
jgi:hypothetical protein